MFRLHVIIYNITQSPFNTYNTHSLLFITETTEKLKYIYKKKIIYIVSKLIILICFKEGSKFG